MINVITTILTFLFVLSIIVLVHEFGHYLAARLVGVRVEAFSFGFGKRIFGKKIGDTDFRVSVIPLGGYVKMAGEEEYDPANLKPYEFEAKNRAEKIFILIMGPLMNVLLAFLILAVINMTGVNVEKYKMEAPEIGYVQPGSPAAEAGLKPGDVVRSVNGAEVKDWRDLDAKIGINPNETLSLTFERDGETMTADLKVMSQTQYNIGYAGFYYGYQARIADVDSDEPADKAGIKPGDIILSIAGQAATHYEVSGLIGPNAGKEIPISVERDGKVLALKVTPEPNEAGEGRIGIKMLPYSPTVKLSFGLFASLGRSFTEMKRLTALTFEAFRKMIVGKLSPKNLSGPIEIAKISKRTLDAGLTSFFMLIAFISLQLGIVNLFPIPALDGGHLLIYSIEAVIRREFGQKTKAILINSGFILLIGLMVFVILNDVAKALPNGWKSLLPFL